jgi:hypothetical protein
MKFVLALCLFLAALVAFSAAERYCSNPDAPKWPAMFSSTVEWRSNHHPHHTFFRLFWDEKNNRARSGGMIKWKGKHYKMEAIYNGQKGVAQYVFYDRDQVKCFVKDLKNKTISGLDLHDADFQGTAIVEYHPVYHWEKTFEKGKMNAHIRVFDTQDDRELKKLGYYLIDHDKAGTMTFHEVNYGPQADSLFKLPKLVEDQCNEKMDMDTDFLDLQDPLLFFHM